MPLISLPAAISLTELSERTFWRKFADGSLQRELVGGKSMVDFVALQPYLCLGPDFNPAALNTLVAADSGDVVAQNEMALILLANDKGRAAIYWLELAARQASADAMNLLAWCHVDGKGVPADDNLGIMWLAKAAAHGHRIAQLQIQGIHQR